MTARTRFALAILLLAAPMAAQAQHSHAAPAAPAKAAAPQLAPAPVADDAMLAGDADDDMWFYDDLFALGFDDESWLDGGDLGDGSMYGDPDGPMAMTEDADGAASAPGMHMGPGGMNDGPGAGMHLGMGRGMGMGDRMGMGGGMGMHGRMGMGGGMGMHRRMGMGMHQRIAQMDLTEAQRTKLRDLHEAHARKAVQRRADLQLAQMDLRKMLRDDRPQQGAINAQVDKITRLRAEGMKSAIDTQLQARAVFTPEQWKALHAPRQPMRAPMMKHDMMDGPEAPKH
jgi:Spy/CpxP family protein refolding chaperone